MADPARECRHQLYRALGECSRVEHKTIRTVIAEVWREITRSATDPPDMPFEEEYRGMDQEMEILRHVFADKA